MTHISLGRCGIMCAECPAFIATRTDDAELRKSTAAEWSKMYHAEIKPDDIVCDGCISDGRHFSYCSVCELRSCAGGRGLDHCGQCDEFACDKLEMFFTMVPAARDNLQSRRQL